LLRASAALDLDRPAEAVAVLESELQAADGSADLHRALGMAYYRSESPERAFAELARAYALDPDNAATGRSAAAIALDLAREQTDAEAKEIWNRKAYEVAAKLAETEPAPAHLELAARAAERAALSDEAVAWLTKAHEATPEDPRVAYDLGRSLAVIGRDRRALEAFEAALEAEPDPDLEVRIHRQIAKTHARNLELADAAHHFRLAGDERAAQQIGALELEYREAIETRSALLAKIAELRTMEAELEALSDAQGVAALRERADAMQSEVNALEANLETVRTALQNL
jgi:tetratricopeptide (TPR) repeat protein